MEFKKHRNRKLRHFISTPIIWSGFIGFIIFDIGLEIYHRICFPLYGLKYIERSRYVRIDRHRLSYLSLKEKLQCAYCGYANGLLQYWTMMVAKTELYWCGIRHSENKQKFSSPKHHKNFMKYGDKRGYNKISK